MRRNIDLVVFLCCALIVFAICLEPLEERVIPDTWAQIRQEETIRIGFSYEPPHAYLDAQGEPTGEAIETARQVVAGMGIKNIDWRMRDFATLLDRLQQREFDVVAASMYMTPQRRRRVAFSNPSLQLLPGLLVKAGNPLRIHSYEDLGRIPGVRIVALDGGVETGILQEVGISSRSVTLVQNIDLGVSAMIADQADVFPLTAYTARRIIDNERSPRYELANPFTLPQMLISDRFNCGFAFRKEDVALQSAWNHVQRGIIGSPAHLAILDRFELGRECLPGGAGGMAMNVPLPPSEAHVRPNPKQINRWLPMLALSICIFLYGANRWQLNNDRNEQIRMQLAFEPLYAFRKEVFRAALECTITCPDPFHGHFRKGGFLLRQAEEHLDEVIRLLNNYWVDPNYVTARNEAISKIVEPIPIIGKPK